MAIASCVRRAAAPAASAIVLIVVLMLSAAPGRAQMNEHRWLLGVDLTAGTVGGNDEADGTDDIVIDEKAGGLGLQFGYLLTPSFLLRFCAVGADHGTSDPDVTIRFGGGTLDAVFLFRDGHPFRPYLFAGLGGYEASTRQDQVQYEIRGPGLAFGAGMHLRLGARATLHGALRVEAINWEKAGVRLDLPGGEVQVEAPIDEDGWASKAMLGVAFWL
ncbi:porin family protein [bacterium]|nr:porin family protein [bacterium]